MRALFERVRVQTLVATAAWTTAVLLGGATSAQAQDRDARVAELDRRLNEAQAIARDLQQTISVLSAELRALTTP